MGSLMEFKYTDNYIGIKNKELSELDRFVKNFVRILEKNFRYVIVSGYVAILFGRNRSSEDIDVFIQKKDFESFKNYWDEVSQRYECINTKIADKAYNDYLLKNTPIRFSKKNEFIPNFELKFPRSELDKWTLSERKKVIVNDSNLYVSPLELEIPYKLYLGSDKDIEDARFLYKFFKDYLDRNLLKTFTQKLNTNKLFNRYIK